MATSTVPVRLLAYDNFTLELPRHTIQELLPASLLGVALQDDPFAERIDIPNQVITPEILQLLQRFLQTGQWPLVGANEAAGNYLNIPELGLLGPHLQTIKDLRPELDLVNIRTELQDIELYRELLREAVFADAPSFIKFLVTNAPRWKAYTDIDNGIFALAAYLGRDDIVTAFLKESPGIDAEWAMLNVTDLPFGEITNAYESDILGIEHYQTLLFAIQHGYPKIVALLLPGADLSDYMGNPLRLAYGSGNLDVFRQVLASPAITGKNVTDMASYPDLNLLYLRLLLRDPRLDFNDEDFHEIQIFQRLPYFTPSTVDEIDTVHLNRDDLTILNDIYWDPRMQPQKFWEIVYSDTYLTKRFPSALLLTWLQHPQLQPETLPANFYRELVWFWPLQVLQAFMTKYISPAVQAKLRDAFLDEPAGTPRNTRQQVAAFFP